MFNAQPSIAASSTIEACFICQRTYVRWASKRQAMGIAPICVDCRYYMRSGTKDG
ncbi:MAG: hypothetical protein J1E57_09050 [Prevotella sp.]|nr:hypothetical protein [Prevotella sp.]